MTTRCCVSLLLSCVLLGAACDHFPVAPEAAGRDADPLMSIAGPIGQISAGWSHTCALSSDGSVTCWGDNDFGQSTAPAERFTQVSAAHFGTCGIRSDGSIACWGEGAIPPPAGTFTQLSSGAWHSCGITTDGSVTCWGSNQYGESSAPAGQFTRVSVGLGFTCAIDAVGSVVCWGLTGGSAPAGTFTDLSVGNGQICGLRTDGSVACWGRNDSGQASAPAGSFAQVSAGGEHSCAVKSDGTVACWGDNRFGQASAPAGKFTQVTAGGRHTCGLEWDGSVACWGSVQTLLLNGRFTQVDAHLDTCALRSDGGILCWSHLAFGSTGPTEVPPGIFTQLSVGSRYACALRPGGRVECWGDNSLGQTSAPASTFTQVSAGHAHACGVRSDETVVCWGDDAYGQASAPAGGFIHVSAGGLHTCGLRSDGSLACWGYNGVDQASPPAGSFTAVSAATFHNCAIRVDGSVACWGAINSGYGSTPTATFTQVSAGALHNCGILVDGTLACWGSPYYGLTNPPTGTYTQVSAGRGYACAVRTDQTVECWGNPTTTTYIPGALPAGGTPAGTKVPVQPNDRTTGQPGPVSLTFDMVTEPGTTTIRSGPIGQDGVPAPANYRLGNPATYFNIETTAAFAGPVEICIDYSTTTYGNENLLELLQYDGTSDEWVERTSAVNASTSVICATTTSLSRFLVAEQNRAPTVAAVTLPSHPLRVGTRFEISAAYSDENRNDVHSAVIDWGDGSSTEGVLAAGTVSGGHAYAAAGVYTVTVTVSDGELAFSRASSAEPTSAYVVVYDPAAGDVSGNGRFLSQASWCTLDAVCDGIDGWARVHVDARYQKNASKPAGNARLQVDGLNFKSLAYDWLVVSGSKAHLKGSGSIDGVSGYEFLLTADDGAKNGGDRVRFRIWERTTGQVVYDNQPGAAVTAAAATALEDGNITFKK